MAMNRSLLLAALLLVPSAGCHDAMGRVVGDALGLDPARPPAPPEILFLQTDGATAGSPIPAENVLLIGGPLDERTHETLGLLVVLIHSAGQLRDDALRELRNAAALRGADAIMELRLAPSGVFGIAVRARPVNPPVALPPFPPSRAVVANPSITAFSTIPHQNLGFFEGTMAAPFQGRPVNPDAVPQKIASAESIVLFAASHPKRAFEPTAFVAACKPLPLGSAADALKSQAAELGATAVVGVRVVVDPSTSCDDSLSGGPFVRMSGLAVREQ